MILSFMSCLIYNSQSPAYGVIIQGNISVFNSQNDRITTIYKLLKRSVIEYLFCFREISIGNSANALQNHVIEINGNIYLSDSTSSIRKIA